MVPLPTQKLLEWLKIKESGGVSHTNKISIYSRYHIKKAENGKYSSVFSLPTLTDFSTGIDCSWQEELVEIKEEKILIIWLSYAEVSEILVWSLHLMMS